MKRRANNADTSASGEPLLVVAAIRRVVFPSVQNTLERMIKDKGVEAAVALYHVMKQRNPAEFFSESTLNRLGYQQLRAQHTKEAINSSN
jgi:hypothetical protein